MQEYTEFQEKIAIAWASVNLIKFDAQKPDASLEDRVRAFTDALEGGLGIAAQFSD